MTNSLPSILPKGTAIWIHDKDGDRRVNDAPMFLYTLDAPVYIVTDEMLDRVKSTITWLSSFGPTQGELDQANFLRAAFAHCITPSEPEPQVRASCRAEIDAIIESRPDHYERWCASVQCLADRLDAIEKRLP